MYVREAIEMFFEQVKTDLYIRSDYEGADKLLDMKDSLLEHLERYATIYNDEHLDEMCLTAHEEGYDAARDEAWNIVDSYEDETNSELINLIKKDISLLYV